MKKFLLSLVAVLGLSFGVQAAETEDVSIETMGWSYNATYSYADGIGTITITSDWGQASTGWDPVLDWSKYSKVTVVIESYANDWGKFYIKAKGDDAPTIEKEFGTITSQTEVSLDLTLDATVASGVYQLAIQGKSKDDVIKISKIYLTEAVEYAEGVNLTYDEWGNISASQFDGYSDDAKVVFTYNTTGTLTKGSGEDEVSVVCWGTGSISSWLAAEGADPRSVAVCDVPVKALGDNTLSLTIAELKEALAFEGEWGKGIYWNMYPQGNSTSTRVSAVIYEVKDTSTPVVNINSEVEIVATEYYSVSGVVSVTPQKGINIVKETLSDGSIRTRKLTVK